MSDLWVPPGSDAPALKKVQGAVESAPPVVQRAVSGAAIAELKYREKQLRRKAARISRKARKANRGKG